MNTTNKARLDPYQILFPVGLIHAIIGAWIWINFATNNAPYPGATHAQHMMGGFLLSFAAGFMLTAIPRFTGAHSCTTIELFIASTIASTSLFLDSHLPSFFMTLFLIYFFLTRIAKSSATPPPHFIFIPMGLSMGLLGSAFLFLSEKSIIHPLFFACGKLFLFYGMMLSFVIGIGAKLIAALLGWIAPPNHKQKTENKNPKLLSTRKITSKWKTPLFQASLFLTSFFIELTIDVNVGRIIRAICVSWIALVNWRILSFPQSKSKLAFWLWISSWSLVLGLWLHGIFLNWSIHSAHLIFISGFGLTTLLVASRVTLAHGNYSLTLEQTGRVFAAFGTLCALAAATRVTATLTSNYVSHLAYASVVWITAVFVWMYVFLPKIVFPFLAVTSFSKAWLHYRSCCCGKKNLQN